MPTGKKANKPDYNFINNSTIQSQIMDTFYIALNNLGFDKNGIDNTIQNKPRYITHNQINYCLRFVYEQLFKPDKPLYNNQKSKINYDDIEQLQIIANTFLDICMIYNKSLGLMSFSYLSGIAPETLAAWSVSDGNELNLGRSRIIKYIREGHKAQQIGLLNEAPVGALAVANNDTETGLEWAQKQAAAATSNTVFLIPSERVERLKISTETDREKIPG
jgi:hypothetical protein